MFDYVFQALEEYALPCCPFCQSKYEGEEQSLNGGVEKWECGTVAAKVDHEWYRSRDCRDQQVRLLVNDNNALRAEVARLQEALSLYGAHHDDCESGEMEDCTCGMATALGAGKEDAHKRQLNERLLEAINAQWRKDCLRVAKSWKED